jgi:hypothetical protein
MATENREPPTLETLMRPNFGMTHTSSGSIDRSRLAPA